MSAGPGGGARAPAEASTLAAAARQLGIELTPEATRQLCALLDELERWNGAYNLTAVRDRAGMLTHHLLDSLAVHADLSGRRVADVGTGAGFPGLPLAVLDSARQFTLIDSNGKKIRFVAHAVRTLGLANVSVVHERVERFAPPAPFDTVIARAFSPLPQLLERIAGLTGPGTRVLAMKGRRPDAELEAVRGPWRVLETRALSVPGLDEARHLVVLEPAHL